MEKLSLSVRGVQSVEGERNETREKAEARYYERGGKHYLLYKGKGGETSTLIFDESELKVLRRGETSLVLVLREGRATKASYETPVGSLDLSILTERLAIEREPGRIKIEASYRLFAAGEEQSKNSLSIEAR